jgi:hypothetical protein
MVLALLLLLGAGLCGELAPLVARAEATSSSIPAESADSSLAAMLGRLPDRPLGLDGAMVTYADVASQTAALGVDAPQGAGDETDGHRMNCRFLNRSGVDRRGSPRPWRR